MFKVRISPEARALVAHRAASERMVKPGLVISRRGAVGNLTRSESGDADWHVEHPEPWAASLDELAWYPTPEDLGVVDGVYVLVPALLRPGEAGVSVVVREGRFSASTLDA